MQELLITINNFILYVSLNYSTIVENIQILIVIINDSILHLCIQGNYGIEINCNIMMHLHNNYVSMKYD